MASRKDKAAQPDQHPSEADQQLRAAERLLRVRKARASVLDFTHMTMPHPQDPADPNLSMYEPAPHHKAIAELLEKVERGTIRRAIVTMPPRHGKSELVSRRFPCWFAGKDPSRQVIFSTYNQEFADDFGRGWRDIVRSQTFRQVFPGVELKKDSQAVDRMNLMQNGFAYGGAMVAVGVGGAVTGRGADLLILDDPIKNDEEAASESIRDARWNWFTSTAFTRLMPGGRVVIVLTRWHEDDPAGRIADPNYVDPEEAKAWYRLDLPAVKDGKALWPERYPIEVLDSIRKTVGPRVWSALYQQNPTPEDGLFFTKDMLAEYDRDDLPPASELRFYAASDHAVSTKQENDMTCLGVVGVDKNDDIWVLPDLVWRRMETDTTVDEMIGLMARHRPLTWWAENEHISKSIGPFLRKRQQEEGVYCYVEPQAVSGDKRTRARSIQGRMAMRKVRFPRFANWWSDARRQLLGFDKTKHDDFVDFLAHIGLGLEREIGASVPRKRSNDTAFKPGTIEWVKAADLAKRRARERHRLAGGF